MASTPSSILEDQHFDLCISDTNLPFPYTDHCSTGPPSLYEVDFDALDEEDEDYDDEQQVEEYHDGQESDGQQEEQDVYYDDEQEEEEGRPVDGNNQGYFDHPQAELLQINVIQQEFNDGEKQGDDEQHDEEEEDKDEDGDYDDDNNNNNGGDEDGGHDGKQVEQQDQDEQQSSSSQQQQQQQQQKRTTKKKQLKDGHDLSSTTATTTTSPSLSTGLVSEEFPKKNNNNSSKPSSIRSTTSSSSTSSLSRHQSPQQQQQQHRQGGSNRRRRHQSSGEYFDTVPGGVNSLTSVTPVMVSRSRKNSLHQLPIQRQHQYQQQQQQQQHGEEVEGGSPIPSTTVGDNHHHRHHHKRYPTLHHQQQQQQHFTNHPYNNNNNNNNNNHHHNASLTSLHHYHHRPSSSSSTSVHHYQPQGLSPQQQQLELEQELYHQLSLYEKTNRSAGNRNSHVHHRSGVYQRRQNRSSGRSSMDWQQEEGDEEIGQLYQYQQQLLTQQEEQFQQQQQQIPQEHQEQEQQLIHYPVPTDQQLYEQHLYGDEQDQDDQGLLQTITTAVTSVAYAVSGHWSRKIYESLLSNRDPKSYYTHLLEAASNYEQWAEAAVILDRLQDKDVWKNDPVSPHYDYELLQGRLSQLAEARETGDLGEMIFLLRTSLSRNLGNVGRPQLYANSIIGTKRLIEDYNSEVIRQLNFICDTESEDFSMAAKLEFFTHTRQAFGRTALLLSGGATMGLMHIGVIKSLFESQLLPRIISGSSCGSIVAAILCTRTDEEIPTMLQFDRFNFTVFHSQEETGNMMARLIHFLRNGSLFDAQVLKTALKDNIGDVTFQEAYNRTRRVLNITVSTSSSFDMPRLLNYLTAPNVLIWSAVATSCAAPFIYNSAPLMAKDKNGEEVQWNPSRYHWIDGSVDNDLPMNKLSELFNVNHFIVCQVNPYIVPFLQNSLARSPGNRLLGWILYQARSEVQHRMNQLATLGVFPGLINKVQNMMAQRYYGDITIVPDLGYDDYLHIVTNPTVERLMEATLKGEKATWPKISIIKNHCSIEHCIDDILYRLRLRRLDAFRAFPSTNSLTNTAAAAAAAAAGSTLSNPTTTSAGTAGVGGGIGGTTTTAAGGGGFSSRQPLMQPSQPPTTTTTSGGLNTTTIPTTPTTTTTPSGGNQIKNNNGTTNNGTGGSSGGSTPFQKHSLFQPSPTCAPIPTSITTGSFTRLSASSPGSISIPVGGSRGMSYHNGNNNNHQHYQKSTGGRAAGGGGGRSLSSPASPTHTIPFGMSPANQGSSQQQQQQHLYVNHHLHHHQQFTNLHHYHHGSKNNNNNNNNGSPTPVLTTSKSS